MPCGICPAPATMSAVDSAPAASSPAHGGSSGTPGWVLMSIQRQGESRGWSVQGEFVAFPGHADLVDVESSQCLREHPGRDEDFTFGVDPAPGGPGQPDRAFTICPGERDTDGCGRHPHSCEHWLGRLTRQESDEVGCCLCHRRDRAREVRTGVVEIHAVEASDRPRQLPVCWWWSTPGCFCGARGCPRARLRS